VARTHHPGQWSEKKTSTKPFTIAVPKTAQNGQNRGGGGGVDTQCQPNKRQSPSQATYNKPVPSDAPPWPKKSAKYWLPRRETSLVQNGSLSPAHQANKFCSKNCLSRIAKGTNDLRKGKSKRVGFVKKNGKRKKMGMEQKWLVIWTSGNKISPPPPPHTIEWGGKGSPASRRNSKFSSVPSKIKPVSKKEGGEIYP